MPWSFSLRLSPLAVAVLLCAAPTAPAAEPPDFRREVAPLLSRAGCNAGACHGNFNGKGGFRLSLRGEDPAFDYAALTRDTLGRRTDPLHPEQSLILQKAVGAMAHEGGRRFGPDSAEYATLREWIVAGTPDSPAKQPALTRLTVGVTDFAKVPVGPPRPLMNTAADHVVVEPAESVTLRVEAAFADGTTRDVTRLAVFEPSDPDVVAIRGDGTAFRERFGETAIQVRYLQGQTAVRLAFVPARPEFRWPADLPERNFVDTHTFAKLKSLRTQPAPLADDSVFLRRAFLDILGVLPTADEARTFLDDKSPDKRARLVDALLRRPEFADFWALKWADLLRNDEKVLDPKGVRVFYSWIRDQIAAGLPLNEFARAILAGRGSTYAEPQANFYRALREPYGRGEAAAQVFLGVRVQCAKCHNHPFDRWTQDDYAEWSAFFARVQYRIVDNNRRDRFDQHEFDGEQIVFQDRTGELSHPRTKERVPPKLLGTDAPLNLPPDTDRLQLLADWVADPANPFFARAQVNRVWSYLFGRGLVEPNDDFRAANPPANPALLDALARDFAEHRFDLRHLVRLIATSTTYQLSAETDDTNKDDVANFSHALIRPLAAEPLLDGFSQVLGVPVRFDGYPLGTRACQVADAQVSRRGVLDTPSARFLKTFGKPDRLLSCDCERSDDTTLVQAFQLITGRLLHQLLAAPDNRIDRLLKDGSDDAAILEELYLTALCRRPTEREQRDVVAYVARAANRRAAWEDVAWGVLNAKEFLLRR
jgi:hypothetical protein